MSDPHLSEPRTSDLHKEVSELERESATAARLFDIRRIIGGLFVVYGVIVTIAGVSPSDADLKKAEGVHINLWTGLAMLALGLFFLVWMKLRPAEAPAAPETGPDPASGPGPTPESGAG
ncbi:hypothetical protein [Streptomyces sp. NPDC017524]|uniref:hypothetical protein n=1 Tax=Streptomyces sp. NPDC017524 TaxID=3364999 RepID=UPI00378E57B8